ncbi:hypothetical protein R6Q57_024598 [Mikania cordata]
MDEVKTIEKDSTTNDEGSVTNLVRNGEIEDGSTGHDHVQKHGHTGQDHLQEDGLIDKDHGQACSPKVQSYVQEDNSMGQHDGHNHVHVDSSTKQLQKSESRMGDIDTTAPFESVKAAVCMFSGIVDWKARKTQIAERRKRVAQELQKAHEEIPVFRKRSEEAEESKQQVLKELDDAKRRVEELKLNLESAQTEESEAKQDAELAKLRAEEMKQGITDELSVAAKAQLEVAQARHQSAVSELETVKLELKNLQKDYRLLVSERDLATKDAEGAVFTCEKTEKCVEDLTIKLITVTEALESAHGAYLEAQEDRTGVDLKREQETSNRYDELQQLKEECEMISQQMVVTDDQKSKMDTASVLLHDLKAELASYMGENHIEIQSKVDIAKTDLKEMKLNIKKTTDEVNNMKLYANSLDSELEQAKATLIAIKQNKWTEEAVIASLEAELMEAISEVTCTQTKENAARLEEQANEAKSRALKAHEELKKAKKAAKEARKREHAVMNKLNTAAREVEAARASERMAHGAIVAVEESKSVRSNETEPESENITISVEEYDELNRKAKEADDEAKDRVSEAISEIDLAKESEVKAVKKLEQVKHDLDTKREELLITKQKAEVRIKRSERREDEAGRKKKKRSLIPKLCMFLCRKKGKGAFK